VDPDGNGPEKGRAQEEKANTCSVVYSRTVRHEIIVLANEVRARMTNRRCKRYGVAMVPGVVHTKVTGADCRIAHGGDPAKIDSED